LVPSDVIGDFNAPDSLSGKEGGEREGKVKGRNGRGGGGKDLANPKILVWHPPEH